MRNHLNSKSPPDLFLMEYIVHDLLYNPVHPTKVRLNIRVRHPVKRSVGQAQGYIVHSYAAVVPGDRGEAMPSAMKKKKLYEQLIREESITQSAVYQLISLYSST